MDDLKDEIARDEKNSKVKTILLYVVSVPLALLSGWGIVTSVSSLDNGQSNNEHQSSIIQKPVYPHAELGNRCTQTVSAYDSRIQSMEQDLADFSARTADEMAAISQQSRDYQDELYGSANQAGSGINREAVENTAAEARQNVSDGLYRVNQLAAESEREMRNIIKEEKNQRNELATCVSLTQEEKDIPDYKVMEYERLSNLY